jgi:hypothetical protein
VAAASGPAGGADAGIESFQEAGGEKLTMCLGGGWESCRSEAVREWQFHPAALAARVSPDFSELPAVPVGSYAPVVRHWNEFPPVWRSGYAVTLREIARFAKETLEMDPFGTGKMVPYADFRRSAGPEAKAVVLTRRQLAFLVVNTLMGNDVEGGNQLLTTLRRCAGIASSAYIYSLLSFLAVLSQELSEGDQGPLVVAATPRARDDSWMERLDDWYLREPRMCYSGESEGGQCADFMAGGIENQALTDIAGMEVGGGANLCAISNTQDESLVQFYPEVLAFAFFTSPVLKLPVPWTLLGARRYLNKITGSTSVSGTSQQICGSLWESDWLNTDIMSQQIPVYVGGTRVFLAPSAFVAVASDGREAGQCPDQSMAMNNQCDSQRRHDDVDIGLWFTAFSPTMYIEPLREAFSRVVRRIGTGPWGAGAWQGDSQQYFLITWLASSLIYGMSLDYYIYSRFCENPGNQCFVLGGEDCRRCLAASGLQNGPSPQFCGLRGLQDVIRRFHGSSARSLYEAMKSVGSPPRQVFDLLP